MLIDISIKFPEDTLNGFQGQDFVTASKVNNSKGINSSVMVLALCTSTNVN